ncbi:MAG: diphthamide biosynthesis enzyme Dph2 [Thermoplasmata archaeon]|nr:MAG: diphthamide biosynthesis enzyme Dph2 [Thermoplasmata archaeon]
MSGNEIGHDMDYDLRLDEICDIISENKHKTVLIQFPEGLKNLACDVKDRLEEKTQANVIISADPCYGACDQPLATGQLGIDLIVQFGHAKIPNLESPDASIFIEAHSSLDVISVVKEAINYLKGRVGLITTVQHVHKLKDVKDFLTENGIAAVIGEGSNRLAHDGQVLGCDLSSATSISSEVDSFLFVGSGNFHAIGVAIATRKPVIVADPYLKEVRDIEEIKNKLMRQRHGAIVKAKEAESFGIMVGTKSGQSRLKLAYDLKMLAEEHGKKGYIFTMNEFTPMNLKAFEIDAYVSTACPRIAIDDHRMYHVPILTPMEFEIALGEVDWEDYRFDELL